MKSDHFVLFSDVVQEAGKIDVTRVSDRASPSVVPEDTPVLVVGEEGVGDPDLLGEVTGQSQHPVFLWAERQPLVLPVLVQIHGDCVILWNTTYWCSASWRRR